jgi:A/G-specific adenine glycosylase
VSKAGSRNAALLEWYQEHERPFPWCGSSDPWLILVSELMSQQTQISRVVPYWEAFTDAFPTPEACAVAPQAEVLRLWSGLGYNSRAIRLQSAAKWVIANGWPQTAIHLQQLPGVGPYTAAAVACLAFGEQVASPDTNHKRVLSRWAGAPLDPKALHTYAVDQLPHGRAADWNQALMDLGATVCTTRSPRCDVCPVSKWCADPTVYEPPNPQPTFDGSTRQARGAVVRRLVGHGSQTVSQLVEATAIEPDRLREAITALAKDQVISVAGEAISIPSA